MTVSIRRIAQLLSFVVVAVGLPFESHVARAQFPPPPFPVLLVDSAVRARLIEEWEPSNRYQHERGYCVRFTTEFHEASFFHPPIVIYTLVEIMRGEEVRSSQHGLGRILCPPRADITILHTHPPFFCDRDENAARCSAWDPLAHQCFPSDLDVASLVSSSRPFDLVQCAATAIVPYWRPR